jgi:hypothetical protein
VLNEDQLDEVLAGKTVETRKHDTVVDTTFRF